MTPSTPGSRADTHDPGVVVPSSEMVSASRGEGDAMEAPPLTKLRRLGLVTTPLLMLAAALWMGFVTCPMRVTTGVPCPGCGLTRAVMALATGNVAEALHWHPLVFLLAPILVFTIGRAMLIGAGFLRPEAWKVRMPGWGLALFAALLIGVWLARFAGYLGGPSDQPDLRLSLFGRALTLLGVIAPPS
jgi:hypothetical protein